MDNNRENKMKSRSLQVTLKAQLKISLMEEPRRMRKSMKGLSLVDHALIALALCDEHPYISFSGDNGKE